MLQPHLSNDHVTDEHEIKQTKHAFACPATIDRGAKFALRARLHIPARALLGYRIWVLKMFSVKTFW
jgi:hypothetical protein